MSFVHQADKRGRYRGRSRRRGELWALYWLFECEGLVFLHFSNHLYSAAHTVYTHTHRMKEPCQDTVQSWGAHRQRAARWRRWRLRTSGQADKDEEPLRPRCVPELLFPTCHRSLKECRSHGRTDHTGACEGDDNSPLHFIHSVFNMQSHSVCMDFSTFECLGFSC